MPVRESLETSFLKHRRKKRPGFLTPEEWAHRQCRHLHELVRDRLVIPGETQENKGEVRKSVRDRLAALTAETYTGSYLLYYFRDYAKLLRLLVQCYNSSVR